MIRSVVLLLLAAALAFANIRCSNGAFEHDCPDTAPVCCFDVDGVSAGCCPAGMTCDSNSNCKDGPDVPANTTETAEHDVSEDVHVSIAHLSIVIGCMVGFLIFIFAVVYSVLWIRRLRADADAQRQLLAAQADSSESDDEVTSETEAAHYRSVSSTQQVEVDTDQGVRRCCICNSESVNCMLMDCQHTLTCAKCAAFMKRCPECKSIIRKRKRLFLAA